MPTPTDAFFSGLGTGAKAVANAGSDTAFGFVTLGGLLADAESNPLKLEVTRQDLHNGYELSYAIARGSEEFLFGVATGGASTFGRVGQAITVVDTLGNGYQAGSGLSDIIQNGANWRNVVQTAGGALGVAGNLAGAARGVDDAANTRFAKPQTVDVQKGGVQANRAAGDAVRDAIAAREAPALIEQNLRVTGGLRRVDVLKQGNRLVAFESKVGRTGLGRSGSRVRQELARDIKLLRSGQVDEVVWEFTRSGVTRKIGPTQPLLDKLNKFGIMVRINN